MSREMILISKHRYEGMIKSLKECRGQSKDQPQQVQESDAGMQDGGKSIDESRRPFLETPTEKDQTATQQNDSENTKPPAKSPSRLFVKKPLSKMDFFMKEPTKRAKNSKRAPSRLNWVNYQI